ncbi:MULTISPECIES: hypothetical protein [Streptomyces]|uniref:hypothetical protein n=1 Tax=Streptomyces TaxID=1883 RepID=UPI00099CE7D5|nr:MULTISPECIES: hypothetical protein [Streptomyces]RZF02008.1 hypothetical protein C0L86_07925 [Streptomyces sp. SCA2-2]
MSLTELEGILPTLAPQAAPDRQIAWPVIHDGLGTNLPSDFRQLCERYDYLVIDRFLSVPIPAPGHEQEFVNSAWHDIRSVEVLTGPNPSHPNRAYTMDAAEGLIPWANSVEGDVWYWRVEGNDPDRWPVVVGNRNDDCEDWAAVEVTATSYLTGLIRGDIPGDGLPEGFPGRNPSVHADTWPEF